VVVDDIESGGRDFVKDASIVHGTPAVRAKDHARDADALEFSCAIVCLSRGESEGMGAVGHAERTHVDAHM
jgi:hypothetical protein